MQAGIPCEIFEGSERTGGRVLTKNDFNKDGMFCELGGELVDTNHADLIALAGELGVEIQELKGEDKGVDLYFFGGKHYSDKELIPLFEPFAKKLAADLEGIYDAEEEFTEKAGKFDKISLAEYLTETGKGVEKWVVDMLRVAYTIEYGRDVEEQSSLNLIAYLKADTSEGFKIFGESDESKRIKGGSSSLPNALAKALEGKVKINKGYRLAKIAQAGPNMTLEFRHGRRHQGAQVHPRHLRASFHHVAAGGGDKGARLEQGETEGDRPARLRQQRQGDVRLHRTLVAQSRRQTAGARATAASSPICRCNAPGRPAAARRARAAS